ncbi:E3 ubiquitin-protein ligase TRIM7 [Xenopus laevis]|uniref:E3 ubiquitin-protein ligase TRIM7 n=2 Tax=Xenopus laevis TaxID=8355 RepID=A0A1L8HJG7_XENLA|nr:E3 ubiquitin-protein ligase TRIM7 [Xenopus laevis]OCT96232.1 hypothetical protein XELAEV_18013907mg [Xenopus laevis]
MATADLRDELSCSICLILYTDPVTLPCGHNFCQGCIGRTWDTQEGSGAYSCPECREEYKERPALPRNRTLGNIAKRLLTIHPEPECTEIFCTYCVLSPVPAAKSCLQCEASLCDTHLKGHSQSQKHILTAPTSSFGERKCPQHDEPLHYYCLRDSICVCESCCRIGEHRGHRVELLSEASEKKKEKVRKVLKKLRPEREETERGAQRLQERRREVAEKSAGETERVTALFRDIKEHLEALEKRLLSDISSQKEKLSLPLTDLIHQLEIKKDELSRKIRHIEELCNMADPLTVLQERESHGAEFCGADNEEEDDSEGADNKTRERDDRKVPPVEDLDVVLISEIIIQSLEGKVSEIKRSYCPQENQFLLLDDNTAHCSLKISTNSKTAAQCLNNKDQHETSMTFQTCTQVLSTKSFPSGRHYWDVDCSKAGNLRVGVAYPSIERRGDNSLIGNNNKSWVLVAHRRIIRNFRHEYSISMAHDTKETSLSCPDRSGPIKQIRVFLDYEAGRLSFYELSEPIRHLHTFIATFTEPLHAAFWVRGEGSVTITE